MALEVGQIVEGKVTGITNFGAFIELSTGQTGLVHISEVADEYVKDVNHFLKQNDLVKVKVLNLDKGKIGLSIRQAQPPSERMTKQNRQSFEEIGQIHEGFRRTAIGSPPECRFQAGRSRRRQSAEYVNIASNEIVSF